MIDCAAIRKGAARPCCHINFRGKEAGIHLVSNNAKRSPMPGIMFHLTSFNIQFDFTSDLRWAIEISNIFWRNGVWIFRTKQSEDGFWSLVSQSPETWDLPALLPTTFGTWTKWLSLFEESAIFYGGQLIAKAKCWISLYNQGETSKCFETDEKIT